MPEKRLNSSRSSAYPAMFGSYVFADWCSGRIWTVPPNGGAETLRYDSQQHPTSFGESAAGRALPLLVLSRDGAFTPAAARASGKPIVLVQNGIHDPRNDRRLIA